MATTAVPAPSQPKGPLSTRIRRVVSTYGPLLYVALVIWYLMLPVLIIAIFSFNDPIGKSNLQWRSFTLDYWLNPFGVPGLSDAVLTSILIAIVSTIIATTLGTLIALALVRHRFRGRGPIDAIIFLPMATPEIVMGASLLTMFVAIARPPFFPLNGLTILIAHIMFNISFVVVTVRARLAGLDKNLEEAAMDLGANEWITFWKVTFPLILPGIVAAGLLAFSLSIDDFVITNFTAGRTVTFPMFIWGSARIGVPPQVNVIGTMMFLIGIAFVVLSLVFQRRRNR
jgi:spermidine/putrescine transport system permease protein